MPYKDPAVRTAYMNRYNADRHDRARVSAREWARANPDRVRANSLRRYNITPEQYDARLIEQDGKCALCREPPTDGVALSIDHDHQCCAGQYSCGACIRGLIHGLCNLLLAYAHDDIEVLKGAIDYLVASRRQ